MMALEGDPISDDNGVLRHQEPPPEALDEGVEPRPGQTAQGAVQRLDGVGRQGFVS